MIRIPKLILASASPRRAEILRMVGWPFEVRAIDIDESRLPGEAAQPYVERVAQEKAQAASKLVANAIILGADTVVVIDGKILGKPRDDEDAQRMLRLLSGREHQVFTGIAVFDRETKGIRATHEITSVTFATMSEDEIDWYVKTREPMDKAGAYAIQGQGARFIEKVNGDYLNVVGLPVRLIYKLINSK